MRFMSEETRQARANLIAAHQNLEAVDAGHRECAEECEDYLAANQAVIAAEQPLKWWQRLDIDAGFYPDRRDEDGDG